MAIAADGTITIVEVKSVLADYIADRKWQDYRAYADAFAFAVDRDFPIDRLPAEVGLVVADAFEAVVIREPAVEKLPSARRRSLTLRFARLAGARLLALNDPAAAASQSSL